MWKLARGRGKRGDTHRRRSQDVENAFENLVDQLPDFLLSVEAEWLWLINTNRSEEREAGGVSLAKQVRWLGRKDGSKDSSAHPLEYAPASIDRASRGDWLRAEGEKRERRRRWWAEGSARRSR